ncbi:hypothetical protein [Sinosporangium siamense]|uniref:Uncharacterized protein n=1 Tax=Sinosporangium siamense TaxID=1367973 RepID=A0A919V642_9ACTN|nr:hypothetical protein [Sinosporangium siamense]GII90572.1 hypothetical protein Ssi02_08030 [Sinosporangium siamense]
MPATEFVTTMVGRLDEIRELLGPAESARLLALLQRITEERSVQARRTWNDVLTLLHRGLPRDHDLQSAISGASVTYRGTAVAGDLAAAVERLREISPHLAALDPTRLPPGSGVEVSFDTWYSEAMAAVRQALLRTPSLSADELRDPAVPGLLRLERPDGGVAVPSFQFGGDGAPIPVVLTVNEILDARRDPWGTADWWLRGNALLGDVPARLLEHGVDDDRLTEAARAMLEPY